MDDKKSSFFSRFLDRATGKDVNFEHVRHKCEPGQKSFVVNLFESLVKRLEERRIENEKPESRRAQCNRQPSAPKRKDGEDEDDEAGKKKKKKQKEKVEKEKCDPSVEDLMPRCFIKEQNPLAPLCCEVKTADDDDEPCPPEGYPQNPRVPGCGCDRCRQSGYHGRCCDRRTYVQQTAEPPPRLERA